MATATIRNPFGEIDEATKAFKPGMAYAKRTDPYAGVTSPYGKDYETGLADIIRAQTQQQLTGPAAQEQARQTRGTMAGAGVLSGTAFDRAQQQVARDVMGQEQSNIAQQTAEARNKNLEFNSNLAFQRAAFGSEEAGRESDYNRDLFLKAAGYNIEAPTRAQQLAQGDRQVLVDQLNAIKTSYPDISKAPDEVKKQYSSLFSQITGGEYKETTAGIDTTATERTQMGGFEDAISRGIQLTEPQKATYNLLKNKYTTGATSSNDPNWIDFATPAGKEASIKADQTAIKTGAPEFPSKFRDVLRNNRIDTNKAASDIYSFLESNDAGDYITVSDIQGYISSSGMSGEVNPSDLWSKIKGKIVKHIQDKGGF